MSVLLMLVVRSVDASATPLEQTGDLNKQNHAELRRRPVI